MNGDDIIKLLGLTSTDKKVIAFLGDCAIKKQPKLKHGDMDAYLENTKLGVEIVFRDERYLDIKTQVYDEGSLVLFNIAMYCDDDNFSRFDDDLPLGLEFGFGLKEVNAKLGKKPAWQDDDMGDARWDFKGYCIFITFNEKFTKIQNLAVQLPMQ